MYFTTEAKANYADCDSNNLLKISAAMKYMQQTSSEQLEYLGFSTEKLYSEQMVFLLSKMCIKVHRMPVCTEQFAVGTAAIKPRGARFVREFVINSMDGERLLSALSLWILVDPSSRRILRPASFPYQLTFQPGALMQIIDDIAIPKQGLEPFGRMQVLVRYSHIDVNQHVNNTVYADFVCDALPYDELMARGLDTLVISFQNEAKWGDIVEMEVCANNQAQYHIVGTHGNLPCFEAFAVLNNTE